MEFHDGFLNRRQQKAETSDVVGLASLRVWVQSQRR